MLKEVYSYYKKNELHPQGWSHNVVLEFVKFRRSGGTTAEYNTGPSVCHNICCSDNYCALYVKLYRSMEYKKKKIQVPKRVYKSGLSPDTTVSEVSRWKNKG